MTDVANVGQVVLRRVRSQSLCRCPGLAAEAGRAWPVDDDDPVRKVTLSTELSISAEAACSLARKPELLKYELWPIVRATHMSFPDHIEPGAQASALLWWVRDHPGLDLSPDCQPTRRHRDLHQRAWRAGAHLESPPDLHSYRWRPLPLYRRGGNRRWVARFADAPNHSAHVPLPPPPLAHTGPSIG
jgi:hypothetical protein